MISPHFLAFATSAQLHRHQTSQRNSVLTALCYNWKTNGILLSKQKCKKLPKWWVFKI